MKILYVHFSEPDKEKVHDTVKALKNNTFLRVTQKEFDDFTLKKMEEDRKRGYILKYEVIDVEDI